MANMIKYDGNPNGEPWLIYKYPGQEFMEGSRLVVKQGQEALIFADGIACNLFRAGTHILRMSKAPIRAVPFAAELYFVNTTSKLDMDWGTANPFQLEDPKYGLILSIRSYGKYGMRIQNARMFVSELAGTVKEGIALDHMFIARYFSGLLSSKIKTVISKFMLQEQISFLEIAAYLDELSEKCQEVITDEFDRFGVEIQNFYIESITPPKSVYEMLQKRKEELALGHGFYQQKRSLDIMEKLADHPGEGSFADAGKGLRILQSGNYCPKCGFEYVQGMKFCGNCGQELLKKCRRCGRRYGAEQDYCSNCGAQL